MWFWKALSYLERLSYKGLGVTLPVFKYKVDQSDLVASNDILSLDTCEKIVSYMQYMD